MDKDAKFYLTIAALAIVGLVGMVLIRFYDDRTTVKRQDVLLDTVVSLEITGKEDVQGAADGAIALIGSLDDALSMYKGSSAISAINEAAGRHAVKVEPDIFGLLQTAKDVASLSDGAFDPTIGSITKLWGIGARMRSLDAVPQKAKIDSALQAVGFKGIELSEPDEVYLSRKGVMLDLGAIAKGYASQRVADFLRSHNIESALIDLGGNVQLIGGRPNGEPWRIGIQDPRKKRGEAICALELRDTSAITAGVYERFAEIDGERYTHIFDPRTGYPVRNDFSSVTVVSMNGAEGDALSTALMVMGPQQLDRALDLLALFPGVEAVFITHGSDGVPKIRATGGLKGRITSLDPSVSLSFLESR